MSDTFGAIVPTSIALGYTTSLDEDGISIHHAIITFVSEDDPEGQAFIIPVDGLREVIDELSDFSTHIGQ